MPRIVVNPDELRTTSSYFKVNSENIYTLATQLRGAANCLDWEVHATTNIDGRVNAACKQASDVASQLMGLSQFLSRKAQEFEETDRQCAEELHVLDGSIRQLVSGSSSFLGQILGWGKNLWPFLMVPFLRVSSLLFNQKAQLQSNEQSNLLNNASLGEYPKEIPLTDTTPQKVLEKEKWVDEQCVIYAQRKRPDLGPTGGTLYDSEGKVIKYGGPKDYLNKYKEKVFQITENDLNLKREIARGYAIIWPPNLSDPTYGHIAIVEQVGEDYVIISESNNPSNPGHSRKLFLKDLLPLFIIP